MKLIIRNLKTNTTFNVTNLSKATEVRELKKRIKAVTGIETGHQYLLSGGKSMQDDCDLCDYKLESNYVVQLMERIPLKNKEDDNAEKDKRKKKDEEVSPPKSPASAASTSNSDDEQKENKNAEEMSEKEKMKMIRDLCPEVAADLEAEAKKLQEEEEKPCKKCKGVESRRCTECGCSECGGKDLPERQLFCEQCEYTTHMHCLDPPLEEVPDDDWYCPTCKNDASEIVQDGEMVRYSKTRAKMPSRQKKIKRDWGRGYATAGKSKDCTLVPKNHFGPIPGIVPGMLWKYRIQVSESGVHRPPVAGIAGRAQEGCQSIVLAGGYEDDVDNADEVIYTGSGGRDLSGNKRTSEQCMDQVLTKQNAAIAVNCHAKFNDKDGADAGDDWKKGKPTRVCRSYKLAKHSKYAPEEGIRYDGLYKVVKYWPEKGQAGFIVWRYLLRRDDPAIAPWKEGAKKHKCIYPDDYEEKMQEKENKAKDANSVKGKGKGKGKSSKSIALKRKRDDSDEVQEEEEEQVKKAKVEEEPEEPEVYEIKPEFKEAIAKDVKNKKLWDSVLTHQAETEYFWLEKVQEVFQCIVCTEVLFKPITTDCGHNVCKPCLKRSFKSGVFTCPMCRASLGKDYDFDEYANNECFEILKILLPGYEAAR